MFLSDHIGHKLSEASALPLIGSLGWLTIRESIDFETSKMVYKSMNDLVPDYLRNIFQKVSEASNRQLRNSKSDLRLPLFRISTGQKSFAYKGAKVWSDLDSVVKRPHHCAPFEKIIKPNYDSSCFPFLFCITLKKLTLFRPNSELSRVPIRMRICELRWRI